MATFSATGTITGLLHCHLRRAPEGQYHHSPCRPHRWLKGREWEWKESGNKGSGVRIAQQLEKAGLDLVNEAAKGDEGVDYNALIGVLLAEEFKALKARVEELEGVPERFSHADAVEEAKLPGYRINIHGRYITALWASIPITSAKLLRRRARDPNSWGTI